jgi:GNAT superfamily N-acetyltransferase
MLSIKTATIADIPLIQEITYKVWPVTYEAILTPDQIRYMLDMMYSTAALTRQINELQHSFLLLYDDEQPIGFASYSTTDTPGIYKLHKIYVDRSSQGKGAGRFLLNAVAKLIKDANAHTLELDVNRDNKARLFYEKLGFSVLKEKDTDIGNGFFMNDYVMRKTL